MGKQHKTINHPGGWRHQSEVRFPRLYEVWLILTGKMSLHRAWQRGYDQHIMDDSLRRSMRLSDGTIIDLANGKTARGPVTQDDCA